MGFSLWNIENMSNTLKAFVLWAIAGSVLATTCPNGWEGSSSGYCYYFDDSVNSWDHCHDFCNSNGVHMACLYSQEANFVASYAFNFVYTKFPIAVTDTNQDGTFNALASDNCYGTSLMWAYGQPSGAANTYCAFLTSTGEMAAGNCREQQSTCVCQATEYSAPPTMNPTSAPSTNPPCPDGWTYGDAVIGSCYYFERSISTMSACQAFCAANGLTMPCINSAEESSLLGRLRSAQKFDAVAIDYYRTARGSHFYWGGSCSNGLSSAYWDTYYPTTNADDENCVWIRENGWQNYACDTSIQYPTSPGGICVCEAAAPVLPPQPMQTLSSYHPPCTTGWETYVDQGSGVQKCYYFETAANTWDRCQDFCYANDLTLPCIEDASQKDRLNTLKAAYGLNVNIPIGFHRVRNDNVSDTRWVWDDTCGSTFDVTAGSPWPAHGVAEDCAFLWSGSTSWNDYKCNDNADVSNPTVCVCEAYPGTAMTTSFSALPTYCPDGYVQNGTEPTCYKFLPAITNADWCNATCVANGATLPCITNDYDAAEMLSIAESEGYSNVLVGYGRPNEDSSGSWVTGCTSSYTLPLAGPGQVCTYLTSYGYGTAVASCEQYQPESCVCEAPLTPTPTTNYFLPVNPHACPAGWHYSIYSDSCYFIDPITRPSTWDSCQALCVLNSMRLPCISFQEEEDFLHNLRDTYMTSTTNIPLNLRDWSDSDVYSWGADCSSSYFHWPSGEPSYNDEKCGFFWGANFGWNDAMCDHNYSPSDPTKCVCVAARLSVPTTLQLTVAPTAAPTAVPTVGNANCPAGWVFNEAADKCYFIDPVTRASTWDSCNFFCVANGVHLPCVQNSSENSFLYDLRNTIGSTTNIPLFLRDWNDDDTYAWGAGCTSTYFLWPSGEPSYGVEKCGFLWGGNWGGIHGWNDAMCNYVYGAGDPTKCVCEASAGSAPATMELYQILTAAPTIAPTATNPCPSGWDYYDAASGTCLIRNDGNGDDFQSWDHCADFCAANGAHLACGNDNAAIALARDLNGTYAADWVVPISFRDVDHDGYFEPGGGCALITNTQWAQYQPSAAPAYCTFLEPGTHHWFSARCDNSPGQLLCVCQAALADAGVVRTAVPQADYSQKCPASAQWLYSPSDDTCIYFDLTYDGWPWEGCQDLCENNDAQMVCPIDADKSAFIDTLIITYAAPERKYPLAIRDYSMRGNYSRNAGCGGPPIGPTEFAPPAQCVSYKEGVGWQTTSCSDGFFGRCWCEKPAALAVASPDMIVPTIQSCPGDWLTYGPDNKCYYIDSNYQYYSWADCEQFCTSNGVDMACVENFGQDYFLRYHLGTDLVPIGLRLRQQSVNGQLLWYDGCMTNYTAWLPGQPAGSVLVNAVIDGTRDGWSTVSYDVRHPNTRCVCEAPEGSAIPTMETIAGAIPSSVANTPTYKVSNGFAFAVVADDKVISWGEASNGGDSNDLYNQLVYIDEVVPSRFAFVAKTFSHDLIGWGQNNSLTGLADQAISGVVLLVANEAAFAGVSNSGPFAIGSPHSGGVLPAALVGQSVTAIAASASAFAALVGRNVYSWGNVHIGGGVSTANNVALTDIQAVTASREAFAALTGDGRVVTWGVRLAGGDSSAVSSDLHHIVRVVAGRSSFVAFKEGGGLVVWGYAKDGGDPSAVDVSGAISTVVSSFAAWAALTRTHTVIAWGRTEHGGYLSTTLTDIYYLYANSRAFAAVDFRGGVYTWGHGPYGGVIPAAKAGLLGGQVTYIASTNRAFAALKQDGTVVTWGEAAHGGEPGPTVQALLVDVHTLCSNDVAFSAIRNDGKVIVWGHPTAVPVPGYILRDDALESGHSVVCV